DLADALRAEIADGRRRPGGLVDSEATLAARHRVSRDTVRRALEHLRGEGLVQSRQGFGWYLAADPVRQTLGRLTTIEATLADAGPDAAVPVGRPRGAALLGCRRVTDRAGDGQAALVSEHRYPAHRTEFIVDIPRADPAAGLAPAGLHLVPPIPTSVPGRTTT